MDLKVVDWRIQDRRSEVDGHLESRCRKRKSRSEYSVDSTAKRKTTISELVLCELVLFECYERAVGLSIFVAAYRCDEEEEESEL